MKKQQATTIIDCSYPINNASPIYPNDPKVKLKSIASLQNEGYVLTELTSTLHVATHLDALNHLSANPLNALDFPLELMISDACVIDGSSLKQITFNKQQTQQIQGYKVVYLYTGWSIYYGKDEYFDHPELTPQAAQVLIDSNVLVLVVDMPSIDYEPFLIHTQLLSHGIWLVENVKITHQVLTLKQFTSFIVPIKIDAEAAFTRVLVMEKDN